MTQAQFIAEVRAAAAEVPGVNPEAAAAHAANESRYGASQLAMGAKNLWGVKATGQHTPYWTGDFVELPTWEVIDGVDVQVTARFRAYPSWRECIGDYGDIAARVYPWSVQHRENPLAWLTGLFLLGPRRWATDPSAYQKAVAILDKFNLLSSQPARERLGVHAVVVDNSPTARKALTVLSAALSRQPAVFGPHLVTRTRRPDGGFKLDVRAA